MSAKNKKLLNMLIIGLFIVILLIITIILILSISKDTKNLTKENTTARTTMAIEKTEGETTEVTSTSIVPSKENITGSSQPVTTSKNIEIGVKESSKTTTTKSSRMISTKTTTRSSTTSTKVIRTTEDLSKIVDNQNPNYSFHKGVIEFKTSKGCYDAGIEVASIDSVDINNVVCYEVVSKANTVMGYYMRVKCNSGNCNRYKAMKDLSKYE